MFSRNVSIVLVSGISMRLLAVAGGVVTARFLGPSGKGELTAFITVASIAMLVISVGIPSANIYFAGQGKTPKGMLVGNSAVFWAVAGLLGFCAIYFGRGLIGRVMPAGCENQLWWLLVGLSLFISLGSSIVGGILVGEQRFLKVSVSGLTQAGTYLLLLLIFLLVLDMGLGGVLLAWLLGWLVSLALNWLFVRQALGRQLLRVSTPVLGASVRYGLKGQVGDIMQWGNYRLDVFIVGYLLGASDLGWYAVAFTVAELIWFVPSAVATVLFPVTAKGDEDGATRFTGVVFRQTMIVILLSCLAAAASGWFIIPLIFGHEFSPSVYPFYLLLPGVAMLGLWKVLNGDLCGRGYPQYGTLSTALALVVTIVLDLTLIPRMGIAGAAIASSLSYAVATLTLLIVFLRVGKTSVSTLFLVRMEDVLFWKRSVLGLLHIPVPRRRTL